MENFNQECKAIKEMIEFEMKTTEDYINNMDIKEKLEERMRALQVSPRLQKIYLLERRYSLVYISLAH